MNKKKKTWFVIWVILFFVFLTAIISSCNISTENGLSAQDNQSNSSNDPPPIGPPPGLSQNPPPVPTIKDAIVSSDKIELFWRDDSSLEEGFIIKKDGVEVGRTDRNISVWTDINVSPGKTYCYVAIAFNKEWITSPSPERCVTIPTPPPTQDPPVIDPSPTPIVDDSPKLLVSSVVGLGKCGQIVTDWILFDDKPYVIWWTSDEPCIGPQKSYLSVFSKNSVDATEVSRVELSDVMMSPISIAIGDDIYIGGGHMNGKIIGLHLNDLTIRWKLDFGELEGDFKTAATGVRDLVVDKNSIFVTGGIMDDRPMDVITIHFDLDGNYIWSERWGTSCMDTGKYITLADNGIDVHAEAGNCVILSPGFTPPSVSGDVILHYDY